MRIGAYEIQQQLARGGQGVVLQARDPAGQPVALKLLRGTSAESRARFERERRLLASLGAAEGFVPLLDAGDSPEGAWLVMPLLTGGTLREKLAGGRLDLAGALALGRALAGALGRAHALGIVHRDVKPENVLFDAPGTPLVADLGLAKHFHESGAAKSPSLSLSGSFRGTAAYVAPEQIADAKTAGPRADVFALGAVLFECLAGEPAFSGDTPLEVLGRVVRGERPALRSLRPDVPAWLERTIDRALATDPAQRFADGGELARALEGERAGAAPSAAGPRPRRGLGFGVLALGGLALAVAGAGAVARSAATPPVAAPIHPTPSPTPASGPTPPVPALSSGEVAAAVEDSIRTAWWKPAPAQAAFARATGQPVWFENRIGIRFALIPPGTFAMGSPASERGRSDNETQHEVTLTRGFYLARTELTRRHYRLLDPGQRDAPAGAAGDDDHAVVHVSWSDAHVYLARLEALDPGCGARLPTEAEWERAARAGTKSRFFWGEDERRTATFANAHGRTAGEGQSLVARLEPNAFGLQDVIGNVWEWCEDRFGPYPPGAATNPAGPTTGETRVLRGGCWLSNLNACRSAFRYWNVPESGSNAIGFRVVVSRGPSGTSRR